MAKIVKITDRIKTFDDVLAAKGTTMEAFKNEHGSKSTDSFAYEQVKLIVEVLNEGKAPSLAKGDYGYYPYFFIDRNESYPGGFRLSFNDYYFDYGYTIVGARLLYNSSDLAIYAGKQFEDIYNDFLK